MSMRHRQTSRISVHHHQQHTSISTLLDKLHAHERGRNVWPFPRSLTVKAAAARDVHLLPSPPMSKAAALGLGRSAPDYARYISSTRSCSHRRNWWKRAGKTRDLPHAPQEAARAQTPRWGRPQGARMHHYLSSYAAADTRHREYGWKPRGILRQHDRRAVHGQAPCSRDIHSAYRCGCPRRGRRRDTTAINRRACSLVLVPRQPSETMSKTLMPAMREGAAQIRLVRMQAAGSVPASHPPWTRQPSSNASAERQNLPVHAAGKTCPSTRLTGYARDFQCSRSQSGVAVALEIEARHWGFGDVATVGA